VLYLRKKIEASSKQFRKYFKGFIEVHMLFDLNDRDKAILELLSDRSFISVADLAHALGVSEVTIRSDLSSLEERGYLVRIRGGAAPSMHRSILEHQRLHIEEKQRIAKKRRSSFSTATGL